MRFLPARRRPPAEAERADALLSFSEVAEILTSFNYGGARYTLPGAKQEVIGGNYSGLARYAVHEAAPVFACMAVRTSVFAEARPQYRQLRSGRPGRIFGTPDLAPLEQPWAGATAGDLLGRMELMNCIAGNAFVARDGPGCFVMRPDWVDIIIGSRYGDPEAAAWDPGTVPVGYLYHPGGRYSGREAQLYLANEVAHYYPKADPLAQFRGMGPLQVLQREVMGDKAATEHKLRYFEGGATPNLMVKFSTEDLEKFRTWRDDFREQHEGMSNAYKTLFVGLGMEVESVGDNLEQVDFKKTQGAGETRIAAAFEVPPVIVGLSEGLESATYSNYGMARRRFADATLRPLWRNAFGSLAQIVTRLPGAELWYDPSDIAFLAEDAKDAAEVLEREATAIKTFVEAGFTPDSSRDAVIAGDMSLLQHSGLLSVQLQPPGARAPTEPQRANGHRPPFALSAEVEEAVDAMIRQGLQARARRVEELGL